MNKPCATFHLNTSQILNSEVYTDFTNGINNQYGSINASRTDMTFYNIDFKTILGDMYLKHEKFNLSLAFITYGSTPNAYGTTTNDRTVMINLGGLNFYNCAYNSGTLSNNSSASIGTITLGGNALAGSFNFTNDMNIITIYKPNNMTNIRVYYNKYNLSTPTTAVNGIYPNMDFFFHIYGVDDLN